MSRAETERTFTGWHMLAVVVSFFGVVVAVNVGMAIVASTSWTGLVVRNSYIASQEFEEKRIAHEAQQAAGWTSILSYSGGTARLVVVDGSGLPVDLEAVTLSVNRPVGGHDDQVLALERSSAGVYEAPLALGEGVWDATASAAETALGPFALHARFRVAGEGQ